MNSYSFLYTPSKIKKEMLFRKIENNFVTEGKGEGERTKKDVSNLED